MKDSGWKILTGNVASISSLKNSIQGKRSVCHLLLVALLMIAFSCSVAFSSSPSCDYLHVQCGDLNVRFDAANNWTMGKIDYMNKQLTVDGTESAYGTVVDFTGIGFIGSAHKENESEQIISLSATQDGNTVDLMNATGVLTGNSFEFRRVGIARDLQIDSTIKITDNKIYSSTTISTSDYVSLDKIYNFMLPWSLESSNYLASVSNQGVVEGEFAGGANNFPLVAECDWVSVYFENLGVGAMSNVIQVPDNTVGTSLLWDVPDRYHKFYLRSFEDAYLPTNYTGTFVMTTSFFESDRDNWKENALNTAGHQTPEPGMFAIFILSGTWLLGLKRDTDRN